MISNETSYLAVLPALKQKKPGGAFIGVGPDQNFSYIAALRPSVAYIIDVRRDNLLLHLLFKALFAESPTRADYLFRLFGLNPAAITDRLRRAPLEEIVRAVESAQVRAEDLESLDRQLRVRIAGFGVPLDSDDYATLTRFHREFAQSGPALKFQSHGRPPRPYYPTYRELLLATDSEGHQGNFLATDRGYEFVRNLQQRDLIIPVVGNLAGPSAVAAIGRAIRERGELVTAMYVSNVELYLFELGVFGKYADNVASLPSGPGTLIIRSIFNGGGSTSMTQRLEEFSRRRYRSYWEVVSQ